MSEETEKKYNFQLGKPGEGEKEVVNRIYITEERPTPFHEEELIRLNGIITAPSEFHQKRRGQFQVGQSYVEFDKKNTTIKLVKDDKSYFQTIIEGKMTRHPFLKELRINSEDFYTPETLRKVLRFNRQHFADPVVHKNLMKTLQNFKLKTEIDLEQTNDRMGTMGNSIQQRVLGFDAENQKLDFALNVPLFEGQDKIIIPLRVEIEPGANGSVKFFLLCDELEEIIEENVDLVFEEESKKFADFALIYKN